MVPPKGSHWKLTKAQRKNHSLGALKRYSKKEEREKTSQRLVERFKDPEERLKISRANTGENHPNWKGGVSFERYCPKFNAPFRERVREFFERRCLWCGKAEADNVNKHGISRRLDVHHITFDKMTCCNDSQKLFSPLCMSCARTADYDRSGDKMNKKLTEIIEKKYNGKCYYTIEEMGEIKCQRSK
jgi:hypothetical protein